MDLASVSDTLRMFFEEDQNDRKIRPNDKDFLQKRDEWRIKNVLILKKQNLITFAADKYRASMILYHGKTLEHHELAHELATEALEMGYEAARWMVAATQDKLLLSQGKEQKFGTQYKRNIQGEWELEPCDTFVTDKERATYDIPPLRETEEKIRRMNEQEKVTKT
jgi:hypothetical protein